jgi:hypothetical protein
MNKFFNQAIWFAGGFAIGLTLISLGHAALAPNPSATNNGIVTEMKTGRVSAPDLDQDYSRLNGAEAKYAESWDQQQRLRTATSQVAQGGAPSSAKKKKINQ